jgi:hypothetical protein
LLFCLLFDIHWVRWKLRPLEVFKR